ncbi:cytochrome-c peroxidase [Azonexus hydrophilus]|uniref:Cytochrome-c peroxidase n=1 Tax=Azonexus hydrophilus TaxID=418702 RepID=A0A1R1I5H3_9RHOO|nr:cytochrome c peroxidase [Azonexus hydrophilus]OMG53953.1 cytochrome-c peroxidase [Azonexus hydrophilus]
MRKLFPLILLSLPLLTFAASDCRQLLDGRDPTCLRQAYARPLAQWPAPQVEGQVAWQEMASVKTPDLPATLPYPLVKLGIRLFFDPALSDSGKIACASCHRPEHAYADTLAVTPGHDGRKGKRNAPALVGAAHSSSLFWDGRSPSLEHQALGPIADPAEMAMDLKRLPAKLAAIPGYAEDFAAAWGDREVTLERIQATLAAYQRTLVAERTAFDAFLDGDSKALDDKQLLGLHLFRTKARCMTCHSGPALNDNEFHNLGLTYFGRKYEDLGRYNVTGNNEDVGKFKTPTLRNVSRSGPWMHNGLFRSLRGIVNIYNAGMFHPKPANEAQAKDPRFPVTSPLIKPLKLDEREMQALEAFLKVL